MKNPIVKNVLVIVLAALILFGLSVGLKDVAQSNAEAVELSVMQALLPGSESFEDEPYTGEDANIVAVHKGQGGFVIETCTYGYAEYITMLVGVTDQGEVTGLVVKDMHETYGLGFNALTDVDFLGQFLYGSGDYEVGTNVDGLTGATVTSKAVARCVNSAVAVVTGADADSGATSWGG